MTLSTEPVEKPPTPWAVDAACRGHDPDLWFPEIGVINAQIPSTRAAIAICMSCPVQDDCLTYAVEHEAWGIWGGMTSQQRDRYRRALGMRSMVYRGTRATRAATSV